MPSLVPSADLQAAGTDDLKETGGALVDAAPADQKKDVVAAAAEKLTAEQQLALAKEITGRWPQGDTANAAICITGFLVAGAVLPTAASRPSASRRRASSAPGSSRGRRSQERTASLRT